MPYKCEAKGGFGRKMGFSQPVIPPIPESLSFAGKSALVTGANTGLGLASCFHLAQRHISSLILAFRNHKAGESTRSALLVDPIVRALPTKPTILIYEVDLARPTFVTAFATKILAEVPTLNILRLNAGISTLAWQTTPETNTEQTFQINYLSNAILSIRLLPLLRRSAETSHSASHLTIVGSRAQTLHSYGKYPIPETTSIFAFLNDRANYRIQRYADSKVLVSMWLRVLAARVDASVVTANNVCPGMVTTNLSNKEAWWLRGIMAVLHATRGRSPEAGARTLTGLRH
ncbi:hypothetical protein FB451DRAFT_508497 [Mycena latifolia]|nr:hypothetical protein FB451DRAFT_390363 [Mycena latifolia]KAJ7460330.1 hypothetical protein FB451DRAFT_508497 [Mycena latifolia]